VFLANPVGEFPLNDDWSYSYAVKSLVEHHHLELSGFTSMPLLAQVFWGALFCLPFGFSFTALRISTIVLGLFGILITYRLWDEITSDHKVALLGAAVVAVNPLYFQLTLTFMTDVPFYTFSMAAFLFLFRALRTERNLYLGIGYIFALLAILIRQLAIVIPLAFLAASLSKRRGSRQSLLIAGFSPAVFGGLLLAYPILLRKTIGLPALYNRSFEPIAESAVHGVFQIPLIFADRLFVQLIYLGLFAFPFLITLKAHARQVHPAQKRHAAFLISIVLVVSITGFMVWQGRLMPLVGNVLFDLGLGPPSLRDTYVLGLPHLPTAPKGFWIIITAIGVGGALLILGYFGEIVVHLIPRVDSRPADDRVLLIFFLSAVLLYAVAIAVVGYLDRYLIWLLPISLMCLTLAAGNTMRLTPGFPPRAVALIFLSILGLFAVAGTHDYMTWNRARWQALIDLTKADNISSQNVDGGFEFNGWFAYNANYQPGTTKSWWWVEDDAYLISFGPVQGYKEIERYSFQRWLPVGDGNILVLQRVETPINDQELTR
jgi:4-amino-4-deoxy-L-arabinose transferase-like glycosyltransferase